MKRIVLYSILALITLIFSFCRHSPNSDSIIPPPPPPDCDTSNVTYAGTIQPIITANCYRDCHNGAGPLSTFSLETYDSVRYHSQHGHIMERIRQDQNSPYPPMPQPPYTKLSPCQIAQFQKWIDLNYPQ